MRTKLTVATALAGTLLATGLISASAQANSLPVLKGDAAPGIVTLVGHGGHVYLPDDTDNPSRLLSSPVWHFERDELAPLASEKAGAVLALGEGLPGRIWATKKPEWLPNLSDRPREPIRLRSRRRTLLKYGLHAAFGVPLYAEGKLQAILEFFSTARQPPDEDLLRIVESIGEQLLERNRGREQQRRAVATADALTLTKIRSEALEATLNAINSGVYLADCHGRVVYMTREGRPNALPPGSWGLSIVGSESGGHEAKVRRWRLSSGATWAVYPWLGYTNKEAPAEVD